MQSTPTENMQKLSNVHGKPEHKRVSPEGIDILKGKTSHPQCKRGIKALQKSIPSAPSKSLAFLAEDITPLDLVSHLPGICREASIPLWYFPSQFDLFTDKGKPITCLLLPESAFTPEELSVLTGTWAAQ
ncbi:H/ACA ribonucleoprotein complex subunit 2 [Nematocida sp. AWRm77]|nr:H/ACA ribonucleoprotein complex subunit 2 [Nematocida sp. AWRm77]